MEPTLLYDLNAEQMRNVYEQVVYDLAYDEIECRIFENEHLGENPDVTEDELKRMAGYLSQSILNEEDWAYWASQSIDRVIAERPKKEEPVMGMKSMYGLTEEQMEAVAKAVDRYYTRKDIEAMFGNGGRLEGNPDKVTDEEIETAVGYAIRTKENTTRYTDIAANAIQEVIDERPVGGATNPLKEVLRAIGLDTMVPFYIDDSEFSDLVYHVDCIGDVYLLDEDGEEEGLSESLTLGRLLTQYNDKIILCNNRR